jgi:hypothetical protein
MPKSYLSSTFSSQCPPNFLTGLAKTRQNFETNNRNQTFSTNCHSHRIADSPWIPSTPSSEDNFHHEEMAKAVRMALTSSSTSAERFWRPISIDVSALPREAWWNLGTA